MDSTDSPEPRHGPEAPGPPAPPAPAGPPQEPPPGRARATAARHPLAVAAGAGAVALIIGAAIGVAAGRSSQQGSIDRARSDAASVQAELDSARERSASDQQEIAAAQATIEKLKARGTVPNFVGDTLDEAQSADEVSSYEWDVKVRRQVSGRAEGTVLEQSPREGAVLARGRSVTLTVAKAAPPSWKTIKEWSGSGSTRTDEFRIPDGKVRLKWQFSGDTNAIINLKDPGGDELSGDLILNEIGNQDSASRLYNGAGTYYLEIEGGSWSLQLQEYK